MGQRSDPRFAPGALEPMDVGHFSPLARYYVRRLYPRAPWRFRTGHRKH